MEQKYIVGDVVMYKNRIHTIINTFGLNNYELSYVRHPVNQAELSGFPLTPNILEKNGWEIVSCKDGKEIYTRGGTYRFTRLININSFYLDGARYNTTGQWLIKYVHELQHHLWVLGINDNMEV